MTTDSPNSRRNPEPAPLPSTVPALPDALLVRHEIMNKIKASLMSELSRGKSRATMGSARSTSAEGARGASLEAAAASPLEPVYRPYTTVVQGVGGSGKSTVTVATVNDESVRRSFDVGVWACAASQFQSQHEPTSQTP